LFLLSKFGIFGQLAEEFWAFFWQTNLCESFWQQFFTRPRYVVNSSCLVSDKLQVNIKIVEIHTQFSTYLSGILIKPWQKKQDHYFRVAYGYFLRIFK